MSAKRGWYPRALADARLDALFEAEQYCRTHGVASPHPGQLDESGVVGRILLASPPPKTITSSSWNEERIAQEHLLAEGWHAMDQWWKLAWVANSMPIFVLDADTVTSLALTEPRGIPFDQIVLPFESFFIAIEPGAFFYLFDRTRTDVHNASTEILYLEVAHHLGPNPRLWMTTWVRDWEYDARQQSFEHQKQAFEEGDLLDPPTPPTEPRRAAMRYWGDEMPFRPSAVFQYRDREEHDHDHVFAFILSFAMHVATTGRKRAKFPRRAPKGSHPSTDRRPQNEALPTEWIVKSLLLEPEIKRRLRHAMARGESGPRAPVLKHIVRGHWRNQACGPGGKQRRWIQIAPHWRGRGIGITKDYVSKERVHEARDLDDT
jgi:hypothetical protein